MKAINFKREGFGSAKEGKITVKMTEGKQFKSNEDSFKSLETN